jgi:hypothetical protein
MTATCWRGQELPRYSSDEPPRAMISGGASILNLVSGKCRHEQHAVARTSVAMAGSRPKEGPGLITSKADSDRDVKASANEARRLGRRTRRITQERCV